MPTFEVRVTPGAPGDQTCTLVLAGEADLAVADDIVAIGMTNLAGPSIRTLVVDLSELTFIDSSGLAALVRLDNAATTQGKHLVLGNVSSAVTRLLKITGLDARFTIDPR